MADTHPAGYSTAQVALHWAVAVLVVLQFLLKDGMEEAWDAIEDGGGEVSGSEFGLAWVHVAFGVTILLCALGRLYLRATRGAPGLPDSHPAPLKLLAHATHWVLYGLIVAMPLLGAAAWFGGIEDAADLHGALSKVLFVVVLAHVAGALVEHFILRSDVLKRMLAPRG